MPQTQKNPSILSGTMNVAAIIVSSHEICGLKEDEASVRAF